MGSNGRRYVIPHLGRKKSDYHSQVRRSELLVILGRLRIATREKVQQEEHRMYTLGVRVQSPASHMPKQNRFFKKPAPVTSLRHLPCLF